MIWIKIFSVFLSFILVIYSAEKFVPSPCPDGKIGCAVMHYEKQIVNGKKVFKTDGEAEKFIKSKKFRYVSKIEVYDRFLIDFFNGKNDVDNKYSYIEVPL